MYKYVCRYSIRGIYIEFAYKTPESGQTKVRVISLIEIGHLTISTTFCFDFSTLYQKIVVYF